MHSSDLHNLRINVAFSFARALEAQKTFEGEDRMDVFAKWPRISEWKRRRWGFDGCWMAKKVNEQLHPQRHVAATFNPASDATPFD